MTYNSIADFAQVAAAYVQVHFDAADAHSQVARWAAPVGDDRLLCVSHRLEDNGLMLTAYRQVIDDDIAVDDLRGEALMRRTFDTRLGTGLLGGISRESGFSLSSPIYAASDAQSLQVVIEYLLRELDSLGQSPAGAMMPTLLNSASVAPGDAREAQRCFARLAEACGVTPSALSSHSFDLLFDDLPGRVTLHPSNRMVLVDFFLHDAITLLGSLRRMVIKSALQVNHAALYGHSFAIGLDSRDFVTSTGCIALERLDEHTWPHWLQYQVEQALGARNLIKHQSLDGAQILYRTTASASAGAYEAQYEQRYI